MSIYISSIAFDEMPINELSEIAKENNFAIEFSSNFKPSETLIQEYSSISIDRLPHNYFPPPIDPFVLNLGSLNSAIRERSIQHCLDGIYLSSKNNGSFFSAHAGLCLDPDPAELGRKLNQKNIIDRNVHWDLFIESVEIVIKEARKLGIIFLIENNVLSGFNERGDKLNPLLCVDSDEIVHLFSILNDEYFGFLLDTAHLKISANTLKFDLDKAILKIEQFVKYIHHSDNDGLQDSNLPITNSYWFLKHMNKFKECVHVLEVKSQSVKEINNQIRILEEML